MPVSTALLVAAALLALAIVIGFAFRMLDGRRRSGGDLRMRAEDLGETGAQRTLVQFSTDLCTRCPQVRRLLAGIANERVGVAHVELDLTNRNDLAVRYRVLQTPTVFLVDASGVVLARWSGVPDLRAIHHALDGIADLHLQEQR